MELSFSTPLKGNLILCELREGVADLPKKQLYTFLWVRNGEFSLEVDHVPVRLGASDLVPLTPLHHVENLRGEGEALALMFDSNFYCIFGHDREVSCNGFLFNGTTDFMQLHLSAEEAAALERVIGEFRAEYDVPDIFREEMLRMQLKRFIILCTRMARERFAGEAVADHDFDIIRQFYVLLDAHFREKKRVQDYADMLHRSPKTLSNLFAACGRPSPLRIIHERVNAEARRLALYSPKSAKEIAYLLGFDDAAAFSRFFSKMNDESITEFRAREKRE